MSNQNFASDVAITVVEVGNSEAETLLNLYDYLKANPITFMEALFLGWVAKEGAEFSKSRLHNQKPLSSMLVKVGGEVEVRLELNPSPHRMVLGLNYLHLLKSLKGSILPTSLVEALGSKTLVVSTELDGIGKYITTWFPGYSSETAGVDVSELKPGGTATVLAGMNDTRPEGYVGNWLTPQDLVEWWQLPTGLDFRSLLVASATDLDAKTGAFQMMYHTWVHWNEEEQLVSFTANGRTSRAIYTLDGGFREDPLTVWGNFLVQYLLGGGSKDYLSLLLNKNATDLLTPSVVYGDPSPLNKAVNYNTVGHLKSEPNDATDNGCFCGYQLTNDTSAYAPADAATTALKLGKQVFFQHQLAKIRVGEGAMPLGKSTITPYVCVSEEAAAANSRVQAGSLVAVPLILGQDEVDKASKLFNRDALCVRVTPVVKTIFPAGFELDSSLAGVMESLAASLLADDGES